MYNPLFIACILISFALMGTAIFMINFGGRKRESGKIDLPLVIIGWILLVLTVIGSITGLILYINDAGGYTGTVIFTIVSPIFIIFGFVIILNIGIASLVEGYQKDKDGKRNAKAIIRGWSMLTLSILTLAAIVITLTILFINHSNSRGDTPVTLM